MHAAGGRVDHLGQLVGIGGLELGQAAIVQQHLGQRIILGQFLQHFLIGGRCARGGLLDHRQLQLAEQDLAQLLGRIQIEGLAGQVVSLLFDFQHAFAEIVRLLAQAVAIDQHAIAFDLLQHHRGRDFDLLVDEAQLVIMLDLRPHGVMQGQRDFCIFSRIFGGAFDGHFIEADLRRTLAAYLGIGDGLALQVARGQAVHVMRTM